MKNTRSYIRWSFVLPVGIIVAATVVFFIIFFDPLLTRVLEKAASAANGAKVDITALNTALFKGRVEIARVQVTNQKAPMQNIVELGPIAFQLDLSELFSKRVIIPEARFDGFKFNTERKASGALPLKPKKKEEDKSAAEKLVDKYADRFRMNLKNVQLGATSKVEFDAKETQMYKQADALKARSEEAPDKWETRIKDLNVDGRLKEIERDIKDPLKIPEALKKLKAVQSDIKTTKKDINDELKNFKEEVKSLQNAKNKDIDGILSRLNLDFLSSKRLMEGFIGPAVLDKAQTTLKYVQLVRSKMPSKKEVESLPPKPRATGMDIRFPTPAAPPAFWLKKAALSGAYQAIEAKGALSDATSNPGRVGKPTVLDLIGAKGVRHFSAKATIDHTGDVKDDMLLLTAKGLDARDFLSSGILKDTLKAGQVQFEFKFQAVGDDKISGNLTAKLADLKLDAARLYAEVGIPVDAKESLSRSDRIKMDLVRNIIDSLEKMPVTSIKATLSGTWNDPDFQLTSGLENEFAKAIKASIGNVVAAQRQEIEAKLNAVLQEKTGEINAKLNGLQTKLDGQLGGLDTKVQEKIKDATGGSSSPVPGLKIPSLDKLFKK